MRIQFLIIFAFSVVAQLSCKKDLEKNLPSIKLTGQPFVTLYLQKQLAHANSERKNSILQLIRNIDYTNIISYKTEYGSSWAATLSGYNFKTVNPEKQISSTDQSKTTILTKVVFDCNESGEIQSAHIAQIETSQSIHFLENELVSILMSKSKSFTGFLSVNTLYNDLLFKVFYNKGTAEQISSKQKKVSHNLQKSTNNLEQHSTSSQIGCTDWYWVTNYNFADGSIITQEVYLYTTCDESIQSNEDRDGSTPTTPCDKIKILKNDTGFVSKMKALKTKVTDFSESGYMVKNGNPTSFDLINAVPGSVGEISIPISSILNPIDGVMHNHTTGLLSVFSPGDIQSIGQLYDSSKITSLLNFSMTAVTASQTAYVLTVANISQFQSFKDTYLSSSMGMDLFNSLYQTLYGITKTASSADNEANFLKLLKATNSGLQLTSVDFTTFSNWSIKTLNENGGVLEIPCTN